MPKSKSKKRTRDARSIELASNVTGLTASASESLDDCLAELSGPSTACAEAEQASPSDDETKSPPVADVES